eukprot:4250100-Pyramimonas_sp.AAC.1
MFCGPTGSSTDGQSGCVRICPPHLFWHAPRTFRGPIGSSTDNPNGCVRKRPPRQHPSHVSWPHREPYRRPGWLR